MRLAEEILNGVRKMPLHRALRPCFLTRALKSYCKRIAAAHPTDLGEAFAGTDPTDLKRNARYIVARLEAAGTRGLRYDSDELLREIAHYAPSPETTRRLMLLATWAYSKHIASMGDERIKRTLRGIKASDWKAVAADFVDSLLYIRAFEQVSPQGNR